MDDPDLPLPAQGGSYVRDASGTLIKAAPESGAEPAATETPAKHTPKGGLKTAAKEN